MQEWPSSPEKKKEISDAQVVEALRAEGSLIDCELYHLWRDQEAEKIDKRLGNRATANINFTVRDARLRRLAGLENEAKLAYEEAMESAELMGDMRWVEEIRKERDA